MILPEQLRLYRLHAGLTQQQSAELMLVNLLTWQRWEGKTSQATQMPLLAKVRSTAGLCGADSEK